MPTILQLRLKKSSMGRVSVGTRANFGSLSTIKVAIFGWLAFVALCLGLVPYALQYGPQASLIAESFPTRLRYGGAGLGYQLASIIAGGPAALIATYLIHQFGTGYAVAVYIAVSAVITLAACAALTDFSRSDIADDSTYDPYDNDPTGELR